MASSRGRSSMQPVRECGTGRLAQRAGTCWLNTSLNMLLLSSNIYNDLVDLFYSKKFSDADYKRFEDIIQSKICPLVYNEDVVLDYIFAHIYLAMTIQKRSKSPRHTPTEILAAQIKVNQVGLEEARRVEGYYVTKAFHYIMDLLFGRYTSNYIIKDKYTEYDKYVLEACAIRFRALTEKPTNHVVCYFKCYDTYYLYDSAAHNKIYQLALNFSNDGYKSILQNFYKTTVNVDIDDISVSIYLYRYNISTEYNKHLSNINQIKALITELEPLPKSKADDIAYNGLISIQNTISYIIINLDRLPEVNCIISNLLKNFNGILDKDKDKDKDKYTDVYKISNSDSILNMYLDELKYVIEELNKCITQFEDKFKEMQEKVQYFKTVQESVSKFKK